MATRQLELSIDEYLRKRLVPVEGIGIRMDEPRMPPRWLSIIDPGSTSVCWKRAKSELGMRL